MESHKNNVMRISWCAWLFQPNTYAIDDLREILLATDNSQYTKVLQELWYMSMLQIWQPKGSWTIHSTTCTWLAVVVNPYWLCIRAAGGWRTYNGDDMYWQSQWDGTVSTIVRIWCLYHRRQIPKYNSQSAWTSRVYYQWPWYSLLWILLGGVNVLIGYNTHI